MKNHELSCYEDTMVWYYLLLVEERVVRYYFLNFGFCCFSLSQKKS